MVKAGQWDRFEEAVEHTGPVQDPYGEVRLEVTYSRPDGSTVDFWGFYDSGDTWRIRTMPDQLGAWHYKARFSDGSPGGEGAFECVASDIPGLISRDEGNPAWFGFRGGRSVLVRSLHVGDCFFADESNTETGEKWDPEMRTAFLDWAGVQGYNMLSIASHYLNRDSEGRGRGWRTPDLWDRERGRPRPEEYRRLEGVLDDLSDRGLMVYPFAGFFGRDSSAPRDPAEQELYIRYTLARLGPYWNLLFMVGGPEPRGGGSAYLTEDEINRLGDLIASLDVFGHLLTVHNPTGDDAFGHQPWVSYVTLQGPKTVDRKELGETILRNRQADKPLYAQETLWPGNRLHARRAGRDYSEDDIRKNAFVMLMSAAAINFGDMDGLSSTGFSGRPDLGLKVQARHDAIKAVWDFFETIPVQCMVPRQDLVDTGHCLAEEGRRILVYMECPGEVSVRLDGASYQVEWINARNTKDRRDGGVVVGGDPLRSPEDGDDWLLDLSRVHTGS